MDVQKDKNVNTEKKKKNGHPMMKKAMVLLAENVRRMSKEGIVDRVVKLTTSKYIEGDRRLTIFVSFILCTFNFTS